MSEIQPPEAQINGGGTLILNPIEPLVSKRQRRPSVRLGDIGGDQPSNRNNNNNTNNTKPWKLTFDYHHRNNQDPPSITPTPTTTTTTTTTNNNNNNNNVSGKPSKTRPLTNITAPELTETLDCDNREGNTESVAIGSWKVKESKKRGCAAIATKRVRSNWGSRIDDGVGGGEGEGRYSGGDDVDGDDNEYREFDVENLESPLREQSPIHSIENLGVDGHRRFFKGGRDHNYDGVELSGPSDSVLRDRNENGGKVSCGEDGVRVWLNGLGLGRYAPVFEVHEVDDEVLPMLTLEDLKDMGINAVGSRRKMYCAIQKLGKGFS